MKKYLPNYAKTTDYWNSLAKYQDSARKKIGTFGFDSETDFDTLQNGSNIFDLIDGIKAKKEGPPKPK